jgi:hypothetical protein
MKGHAFVGHAPPVCTGNGPYFFLNMDIKDTECKLDFKNKNTGT